MIVALYGSSCTGKTATARALAAGLALPLRLCGEAVRGRASDLSVSWLELPDEQHRAVDDETRSWCRRMRHCIVEGRFLDRVLLPLGDDALLVCLTASDEVRRIRMAERLGKPCTLGEINKQDELDCQFRMRLY
jgi:cytidylate kinase